MSEKADKDSTAVCSRCLIILLFQAAFVLHVPPMKMPPAPGGMLRAREALAITLLLRYMRSRFVAS